VTGTGRVRFKQVTQRAKREDTAVSYNRGILSPCNGYRRPDISI